MRKRKLTKMGGKALFVMVLSSALLAAGCMEEGGAFGGTGVTERTLGLRMEATTKVSVDDASGACAWTSGDAIAVRIYGTAPAENKYDIPVVDAAGRTVNVNLEGDQDIRWYSVYPASARVDEKYGDPELQVKYASSYALPSGLSNEQLKLWSPLPMVAQNTAGSTSLAFFHVGGVLRIKLLNVPASATSCTVTLEGMSDITGTFKVENPGTATATTSLVAGTGAGNTVEFTGIPSIPAGQPLWLNVPLPTGDYSALTSVKVKAGSKEAIKAVKWSGVGHAQGRRLSFDFNAQPDDLDNVNLAPAGDATLWKGQPYQCVAMACDANGTSISGATISWESSDPSVATVDNGGNVMTKAAGSAVLTATATLGGVSKTAEYTVHVNEITGLSLSCGPTMTLRTGTARSVTARAVYTTNGTPEVPEVNWVVAPSTLATLSSAVTASGAANTLTAGTTVGNGTLTVSIPANKYGTNAALTATCSFQVKLTEGKTLPGKFSISATEQVQFSSGNLQVNYTGTSASPGYIREWLFSENQWDYFRPTAAELQSLPTVMEGTTVKLSYFAWATAGHESTDSQGRGLGYGYNSEQTRFEPHEYVHVAGASTYPYDDVPGYGVSQNTWIWATGKNSYSVERSSENSWNWDISSGLSSYCDWGVNFDDDGVGRDKWYEGNSWFTMSYIQWAYVLNSRHEAKQKRGPAIIISSDGNSSVGGLVLLPDDWVCPAGCTFIPGVSLTNQSYDPGSQTLQVYYTDTTWPLMEAAGAVFLPAIGSRSATTHSLLMDCTYWTSSIYSQAVAPGMIHMARYILYKESSEEGVPSPYYQGADRSTGLPVRLVRLANP